MASNSTTESTLTWDELNRLYQRQRAGINHRMTERLIVEAIEDAIWEGAREWDAYSIPVTEEPARKAWQKIKGILNGR